jgi:hypothetical protein
VSTTDSPALRLLHSRFGARPFRVSEAVDAGVSRTTLLHHLRQRGVLESGGRGVVLTTNQ